MVSFHGNHYCRYRQLISISLVDLSRNHTSFIEHGPLFDFSENLFLNFLCYLAGMGFFTDAYDLFCVPVVSKLLGRIYYYKEGSGSPGSLPPNVNAAVNGVALCGTLAGQLFFGWLGE